jgi:hypothetical protein
MNLSSTRTGQESAPREGNRPGGASQALGVERRTAERYPCNLETRCEPIARSSGGSWPACVTDISTGGIGMVLERRFERNAVLSLRLESPDGDFARTLFVRVVYSVREADGRWRMGCVFASELLEEELQPFQAQRVRPEPPDCRAWVRFRCDVETTCRAVTPPHPDPWTVRVLDVSAGGMSLASPRELGRGALLSVDMPEAEETQRQQILLRVVGCRPATSDQWTLGCEVADQLSEQDLQGLT